MPDFTFDRLTSVNPKAAATAAFSALSSLQVFPPEQRVAGASLLFLALVRHFNVHPGNALEVANNIAQDQSWRSRELGALAMYLKHELDKA